MNHSMSLTMRAVLALGLMVGFYVFAIGLAALLLYMPYAEVVYAHRVHPKLVILCLIGAGVILYSIVPRRSTFEPPGPELDREAQPRLFAIIDELARQTGQKSPAHVYLVADVNAWVAEPHGVMGAGRARVMGLGLPLLQALSVSELRAVLAHEFGHYHAGDTSLGPLVYTTRAAIGRTIANLQRSNSILQLPFQWYGKLFLWISLAVSRAQEYAADALGARVAGTDAMISGLQTVHGVAPAFQAYVRSELQPVLGAGFRPPVAEGFAQFMAAEQVATVMARAVAQELADGVSDSSDTHPALRERVEALRQTAHVSQPADDRRAICLLDGVPRLERELLGHLMGGNAANLQALPWGRVGEQVVAPSWSKRSAAAAAALRGLTPEGLAEPLRNRTILGGKIARALGQNVADSDLGDLALHVVSAALVTAGKARGATVESLPGEPVRLRLGEVTLVPSHDLPALVAGELSQQDWAGRLDALGLLGVDLGGMAPGTGK